MAHVGLYFGTLVPDWQGPQLMKSWTPWPVEPIRLKQSAMVVPFVLSRLFKDEGLDVLTTLIE